MNDFWFVPAHGDSRYPGSSRGARRIDFEYARAIAQAADQPGYEDALLPTGPFGEIVATTGVLKVVRVEAYSP